MRLILLIHVKEKEQTVRANYVVVLTMENAHPYSWIRQQIFLKKSDEIKAGKCWFLAWFDKFKVPFREIIDVWTLLIQKRCVNGVH